MEPRCPNVATSRGRCDEHRRDRERERSAQRRAGERSARAVKVYHSAKWLRTREAVLGRDPICVVCDNALSTDVDHVVPMSRGGAEYELANLRGLCGPCHWERHARER